MKIFIKKTCEEATILEQQVIMARETPDGDGPIN